MATAFKQIKNNAKSIVNYNALNNTTTTLSFDVEDGSVFPMPGNGFYVTAWDVTRYFDPSDDPSMRIGLCTARTGDELTVTWGQEGTPVTAITGRPMIALLAIDVYFNSITAAINNIENGIGNSRAFTATVGLTGTDSDYICDGTNDQVEINQAIAAVSSAGGGTVVVRPGVYSISSSINMASNVDIMGENYSAILKPQSNIYTVYGNAISNSRITKLTIDGELNTNSSASTGIRLLNTTGVHILHNSIINSAGFGVFLQANSSSTSSRTLIDGNYITGQGMADVIGGGPTNSTGAKVSDVIITNNHIVQDCTTNGYENVFDIVASNRVVFSNNDVQGVVQPGTEQFAHLNVIIEGNIVRPALGKTYTKILVNVTPASTTSAESITVSGNQIQSGDIEISGVPAAKMKKIVCNNNIVDTDTIQNGISFVDCAGGTCVGNQINGANTGVYFSGSSDFIILGNQISDCNYGVRDVTGDTTLIVGENSYVNILNINVVGAYTNILIPAAAPSIRWTDTGQTAPAGVFEVKSQNDALSFYRGVLGTSANEKLRVRSTTGLGVAAQGISIETVSGGVLTGTSLTRFHSTANADNYINNGGKFGVNTTSPTAYVDSPASTLTAAGFRMRSGVAPTSPNDGDIWYDGTNVKVRIGGTTKTFTIV